MSHQTTPQKITLRRRCRSESTQLVSSGLNFGTGGGTTESNHYNHMRNSMRTRSDFEQQNAPKLHIDVVSLNTTRKAFAETRPTLNNNMKEHTKENILHNEPEIMDLKEVYLNDLKYNNSSNTKPNMKSKIAETAFNPKESIFDSNKRRIRARSESEPHEIYTTPIRGFHYMDKIRDEISQKRPRNAPSPNKSSKMNGNVIRKDSSTISCRISNPHHANLMTRSVRSKPKTPVVVASFRSKVHMRPSTPLPAKKSSSRNSSILELSSTETSQAVCNNGIDTQIEDDIRKPEQLNSPDETDRLSENDSTNFIVDTTSANICIENRSKVKYDCQSNTTITNAKTTSVGGDIAAIDNDNDDDAVGSDDDDDDDDEDDDDLEDDSINEDEIDGYTTDPEDNYKSYLASYSSDKSLLAPIITLESVPGGKPTTNRPLAPSLFPYVPPYITFATHVQKGPIMPADLTKILKWKLTTITPIVVRKVLINSGFRLLKS